MSINLSEKLCLEKTIKPSKWFESGESETSKKSDLTISKTVKNENENEKSKAKS
jgi:hypothetical protein